MLADVLSAFSTMLAGLSSVEEAPPLPLPQVPATRTAWAYLLPGDTAISAHTGPGGGKVFRHTDDVLVEWHLKVNADQIALFLAEAPGVLEEFRDGILRLASPTLGINGITTSRFGQLGWGNDFTYGFRLRVGVTHFTEVTR